MNLPIAHLIGDLIAVLLIVWVGLFVLLALYSAKSQNRSYR